MSIQFKNPENFICGKWEDHHSERNICLNLKDEWLEFYIEHDIDGMSEYAKDEKDRRNLTS